MAAAAGRGKDARVAHDFRTKVKAETLAYEPLAKRIVKAANDDSRSFPELAMEDAAKAEMNASVLYSWARSFVPPTPIHSRAWTRLPSLR